MIQFTAMPPAIENLPRDERGYPVPWFVAWLANGQPEFRCMDRKKLVRAVKERRCWVCGERLDLKQHVFVIGPMCSINKTSAEPPCHEACAEFSARNCPFLTKPAAVRREANLPPDAQDGAGMPILRNPGVTCLWFCQGYQIRRLEEGFLFALPNPSRVKWFREGRQATRAEILESINTGLPLLRNVADQEGPDARRALDQMTDRALKFVPAT